MKYLLSAIPDKKGPLVSALKNLYQLNPKASKYAHHPTSHTGTDTHFHPASDHPCDFMDTFLFINPGDGVERTENDSERIAQ